jgi:hypothetical protein
MSEKRYLVIYETNDGFEVEDFVGLDAALSDARRRCVGAGQLKADSVVSSDARCYGLSVVEFVEVPEFVAMRDAHNAKVEARQKADQQRAAQSQEQRERAELARLQAKYGKDGER